jgi:hypothetical protein
MTGTNCDLFTHKSSRSYLNHLVPSVSFFLSVNISVVWFVYLLLPILFLVYLSLPVRCLLPPVVCQCICHYLPPVCLCVATYPLGCLSVATCILCFTFFSYVLFFKFGLIYRLGLKYSVTNLC